VGGRSFVFFRNTRPDATDPRTGRRYTDVSMFWVPSESDQRALAQDQNSPFFTTPRFDGHPSVLVRASRISELTLHELTEIAHDARLARVWSATSGSSGNHCARRVVRGNRFRSDASHSPAVHAQPERRAAPIAANCLLAGRAARIGVRSLVPRTGKARTQNSHSGTGSTAVRRGDIATQIRRLLAQAPGD
jgi:hypothetical protein